MIIEQDFAIERGWVSAGELSTNYEVQGTGDPLVILHGGFATVHTFSEFSRYPASDTAHTARSAGHTAECQTRAAR